MSSLWTCLLAMLYLAQLTNAQAEPPVTCRGESQFYCASNDKCLAKNVVCDGQEHCPGGEDEKDCVACTATTALSLGKHFCANSSMCINLAWKCDGSADCDYGEDETDCHDDVPCPDDMFACGDGQCIQKGWQCDDQADCHNNKDEEDCGTEVTCSPDHFMCNSTNTCIDHLWKCDGENDCEGGEDELGCGAPTCGSDRFLCSSENKCLPNSWRCDNDNDCESGEDEQNCDQYHEEVNTQTCASLEFKCHHGSPPCIISAWKCDGAPDCEDNSDEHGCDKEVTCSPNEFYCQADKNCIPSFLTCSGKSECTDGADEKLPECAAKLEHHCDLAKGEFACREGNGISKCIDVSLVCDGKYDCPLEQESKSRDEQDQFCADNAVADRCADNPCHTSDDPLMTCVNVYANNTNNRTVGYYCQCTQGYHLANGKCADMNECADMENPVCDQICVNTVGSYTCDCNRGFGLESDKRSCKVDGQILPKLLFTNRHDIRSIHIHSRTQYMPLLDSNTAVAIDFDYKNGEVFYSDSADKKIYKFKLPSNDSEQGPESINLNIPGIQNPNGLAYDWIYRHLYWTDTAANTINMACVDEDLTVRRTVVLYKNNNPLCNETSTGSTGTDVCIDEPRALAVHPHKGWVFWSDWGSNPHIALAALDGSHMEMIAYNKNTSAHKYLLWPNGLTLDLSNSADERLYWADAQLHSLFSCAVERCMNDISLLVYDYNQIKHPFSITVFENKLYWSDWSKKHIMTANKFTGGELTQFLSSLEQPMDLKVYHPTSQPEGINHCKTLSDTQRCQQICVPRPWTKQATDITFSRVPVSEAQHRCLCVEGYTLNADGINCTKLEVPTVKALGHSETTDRMSAVPADSSMNVGTIAAIASSSVLLVAIVIGLVLFMAVRRMRRNRSKSMNFDNPIYKRTTEDKLELPRHEYQPSQTEPSAMVPLTSSEGSSSNDYDV